MPGRYDGIPLTLILDGKLQSRTMRIAGLDEGWLRRLLQGQGIERDADVLLAALDTQGMLLVQERGEAGRLLTIPAVSEDKVRW